MSIQHVHNLIKELRTRQARVAMLEEDLKQEQANVRYLIESEIPDALDDAGIAGVVYKDGTRVTIEEEFIPQIKVDDEEAAFNFLRKAGYGDKLKNVITLEYGMKEDGHCRKVFDFIQKHTMSKAHLRTYIHPNSAKALGADLIKKGVTLPEEISIFPLRKIKLTKPRTSTQDGS